MLKTKTYRPSDYFVFKVYEPKERIVMTNAFKDKVVQHSLCDNILEPAFSKAFIRDNYASQSGRGTHDGLLDREKISLSDIEQSYGSWRSHAEKGNCYHLIQKTDSLFQNLFKESEKQWPKV